MPLSKDDVLHHPAAKTLRLDRIPPDEFDDLLEFFAAPKRIRRMEEAEVHHDRPALAGVIREFEAQPLLGVRAEQSWLEDVGNRQAVGAIVRIVMEDRGWLSTGMRGSLGLSRMFRKAERLMPPNGHPFRFLWVERHPTWKGRPSGRRRPRRMSRDSQGRTPAQEMRDYFIRSGMGTASFGKSIKAGVENVRNWLRQADVDDGVEVAVGRCCQPGPFFLNKARGYFERRERAYARRRGRGRDQGE